MFLQGRASLSLGQIKRCPGSVCPVQAKEAPGHHALHCNSAACGPQSAEKGSGVFSECMFQLESSCVGKCWVKQRYLGGLP